jgi:hypothetical protein
VKEKGKERERKGRDLEREEDWESGREGVVG